MDYRSENNEKPHLNRDTRILLGEWSPEDQRRADKRWNRATGIYRKSFPFYTAMGNLKKGVKDV